jgi:hypothetical protein
MGRKKKIEFLMNTEWMFEKPIDQEHKEYKLLSYFQKMGEKLDNMELYPSFIELSLHLANIQTLIKDKKIIYTDKKFSTIDDELLVKDLKIKEIPALESEEMGEFTKILSYSAPRMLEYFNIAKSVWEIVFDSIILKVKKNKDEILTKKGYFYYINPKDEMYYMWEYDIKSVNKKSPESKPLVNLIYSDKKNNLTITKIINTFSQWNIENKSKLPLFEMSCDGEFPINETLLPLFKRKLISYVNQVQMLENYKKNKEQLNS